MASSRIYTSAQIGPKRSLTPEGFLLCRDVPVARVGTLLYGEGEVPLKAGPDGVISITRDPDDVFSPDAIASFMGKPVTNDHPPNGLKVTSKNWKQLSVGDTINVRRGDGASLDSDYLYADLLIKDADAIKDVLDGKREVSAGYDADYEQTGQGRGRQKDIIGNHVALVDRGRCGPRCSIGDTDTMATRGRSTYADRIRHAFKTRDEGALVEELKKVGDMLGDVTGDEVMDPAEAGGDKGGAQHHVTINVGASGVKMPPGPGGKSETDDADGDDAAQAGDPAQAGAEQQPDVMSMLKELLERTETLEKAVILLSKEEGDEDGEDDESGDDTDEADPADGDDTEQPGKVAEEVKPATGDRRRAAVGDSTSMAAVWQDTISKAEILAPGKIRVPTFDSAKPAKVTFDTLCNLRRNALAKGWGTTDGRSAISELYTPRRGKKPDFTRDAMTCQETTTLFNGAANARRKANIAATTDGVRKIVMDRGREMSLGSRAAITPADINARARDFFKNV